MLCSVEGCESPVVARGWCRTHYVRWHRWGDPLYTQIIYGDDIQRFWSKVNRDGSAGFPECWLWQGKPNSDGYGEFLVGDGAGGQQHHKAHRYVWEITHGPIPEGLQVRHYTCDNPPCVNPAHLCLGTHADNMADMVAKGRGRGPRGEHNSRAKLTSEQVLSIRERYRSGAVSYRAMAREYGVDSSTIGSIVRGQSWGHLDPVTDLDTSTGYHPGQGRRGGTT